MKLDWYSKLVLTVIALCLLWLSVKDAVILRHVQAAGPMEVRVTGRLSIDPSVGSGSIPVSITAGGESFPVRLGGADGH
jgi:hypothetical protein